MKFQEDLELREPVFRKIGMWIMVNHEAYDPEQFINAIVYTCQDGQGNIIDTFSEAALHTAPASLPPIEKTWEVCAEYLVPLMRGNGWKYETIRHDLKFWFYWYSRDSMGKEVEIINDNIARAACEAFLEVEI